MQRSSTGKRRDRVPRMDVLAQIQATQREIRVSEERLRTLVQRAWQGGASWAEIGGALGISKQAAWERFQRSR